MDIYRVNGHSLTSDAKYKKKKTNLKKPKVTTQNNFTIGIFNYNEKLFKKKTWVFLKYQYYFVSDDEYINKVCFKETLAIVNENQEELGEFIGKIRRCNFKTNSTSLMININSTNVSECGQKIGMSLITNTTTDFHSYEEKWSQRLKIFALSKLLNSWIYYFVYIDCAINLIWKVKQFWFRVNILERLLKFVQN